MLDTDSLGHIASSQDCQTRAEGVSDDGAKGDKDDVLQLDIVSK